MSSAKRIQLELESIIEQAVLQCTVLEESKVQAEQQAGEIVSLQEANSLMVQQLKVNQESISSLQKESDQVKASYHECTTRLDIAQGKVLALTVQLTERDQKVERLVKEQTNQLAIKEQQLGSNSWT